MLYKHPPPCCHHLYTQHYVCEKSLETNPIMNTISVFSIIYYMSIYQYGNDTIVIYNNTFYIHKIYSMPYYSRLTLRVPPTPIPLGKYHVWGKFKLTWKTLFFFREKQQHIFWRRRRWRRDASARLIIVQRAARLYLENERRKLEKKNKCTSLSTTQHSKEKSINWTGRFFCKYNMFMKEYLVWFLYLYIYSD